MTRATWPPSGPSARVPCCCWAAPRRGRRASTACPARSCPSGSTAARCPRSRCWTCAERRHGLHALTAQALADVRSERGEGDRPAEPAGLVELPLLPLLRAGLALPGLRRGARPAPRRRLRGLPPLRPPRAGALPLPGLLLDLGRAPRGRHRAARARADADLRRRRLPGLPARRRLALGRGLGRAIGGGRGGRGAAAPLRGGALRRADRHPDGRQGPRLPRRAPRGRARRRQRRCASRTSAPRSGPSR